MTTFRTIAAAALIAVAAAGAPAIAQTIDEGKYGQFVDEEDVLIAALFKLYPWEDMLREPYAAHLPQTKTLFLEPAWKAILSNKGILPLLWERHRGHPNLLPAAFADDAAGVTAIGDRWVRKPLFSREGWDIELHDGTAADRGPDGGYGEEGHVIQEQDIWARRPGTGEIAGYEFDAVLGRKLTRSVSRNTQLRWSDLEAVTLQC